MDTIVTGAAFGVSLVASFMYQPHLIASQFTLQQWDMAQTFLTATASSALAIELLRQLHYQVPSPRSWSSTGLFNSAIDGNILGGFLLGAGMALSSSCPGMALPQLALGIPDAPAIIAGGCTGGVVWCALLRPWLAKQRQRHRAHRSRAPRPPTPETSLPRALGLGHTTTFLLWEAALVLLIAAAAAAAAAARGPSARSPLHPVGGGLLIGGSQLVSLLLRRGRLLGVSTCYEQLGDWVVYVWSKSKSMFMVMVVAPRKGGRRRSAPDATARPGTDAMLFAVAMVGGAWALATHRPGLAPRISYGDGSGGSGHGTSTVTGRAFAGGFLMAVGSRLAGGCACGHGISGLALMSLSSLVTMIATFCAAIGVSNYLA